MPVQTSVIICTHNPRPEYLRRALDALRAQTLASSDWELLLIDNASQQRLSDTWDLVWHANSRHIREDELGLTRERLRGIRDGRGHTLVFVDDDNVLAPDFLERVQAIAADNPHLGVFGAGTLEPDFETLPAPETVPFLGHLALRSVSSILWSNNPADISANPWGAGISVTRETAQVYVRLVEQLDLKRILGRNGDRLFCAEDDLFSWAATLAGKGFGVFPELKVTHLISAHRLNPDYLVQLMHDHSFSHEVLRYRLTGAQGPKRKRPTKLLWHLRLLLHGLKNGRFSMQCRQARFCGLNNATQFILENGLIPLSPSAFFPAER